MISDRWTDIGDSSHILPICRYIRSTAYMNELAEIPSLWINRSEIDGKI